jgi:hypothetical protein
MDMEFLLTFVADFGDALSCSKKALKRESGENPEQTRCCKLFFKYELFLKNRRNNT